MLFRSGEPWFSKDMKSCIAQPRLSFRSKGSFIASNCVRGHRAAISRRLYRLDGWQNRSGIWGLSESVPNASQWFLSKHLRLLHVQPNRLEPCNYVRKLLTGSYVSHSTHHQANPDRSSCSSYSTVSKFGECTEYYTFLLE